MDIERARQRLLQEEKRLRETEARLQDRGFTEQSEQGVFGELSSHDQHPADQGTETFEAEKTLSILDQVRAELEEVKGALERIERDDYGKCERCGKPIGDERLEARPETRLCLEDQARLERDLGGSGRTATEAGR